MLCNTLDDLERRANEESRLAKAAQNPVMASAHRLLAIQYEEDLRQLQHAPGSTPAKE